MLYLFYFFFLFSLSALIERSPTCSSSFGRRFSIAGIVNIRSNVLICVYQRFYELQRVLSNLTSMTVQISKSTKLYHSKIDLM